MGKITHSLNLETVFIEELALLALAYGAIHG